MGKTLEGNGSKGREVVLGGCRMNNLIVLICEKNYRKQRNLCTNRSRSDGDFSYHIPEPLERRRMRINGVRLI